MNTAEQIQLSYINTTNTGIMIVSWLRFNGSQPIHINEITLINIIHTTLLLDILFFSFNVLRVHKFQLMC